MGLISTDVDRPEGRIGPGSGYHCVHEMMSFSYWVTDWQPFDYFSTLFNDPLHEGLITRETYHVESEGDGSGLRYTLGAACDAEGKRHEAEEAELIALDQPHLSGPV